MAMEQPALSEAINAVGPGCALVVASLPCLTWDATMLKAILLRLSEKGAWLLSITEAFDSSVPQLTHEAAATLEGFRRNASRIQRRESLLTSCRRNLGGRPRSISPDAWAEVRPRLSDRTITPEAAAELLKVSRSTVYRMLRSN